MGKVLHKSTELSTDCSQRGWVLITGASSGIGKAAALRLGQEGYRLVLASEQPEALREVRDQVVAAGGTAVAMDLNLLVPEEVETFMARLTEEVGFCEIVVNNAGIGLHKTLSESTDQEFQRVFQVNFFAVVTLCRSALSFMAPKGSGQIINISSASARRSLGHMSCYGATKGAMHCFSQALRLEVAEQGIAVTEILPISVSTSFFDSAGYKPKGLVQTPDYIAGLISRAIRTREPEICSSTLTRMSFVLDTVAPNFASRLLEWQQRWARRKQG